MRAMQNIPVAVAKAFTPTGALRAAINLGNPVLAGLDAGGAPVGVSVDLANAFAQRLGVAAQFHVVRTAAASVEAVTGGLADVGFFAIDPARGAGITFTAAYVLIEGCYLVPEGSPLQANEEVDRAGTRIVVGQGSAYDLYLTREIKAATLVRAASSQAVVETFVDGRYEVAAGVKQQLVADAQRFPGQRLLPGRFMVIQQAMGCPKTLGADAAQALAAFVEQAKASGFVADALARHRQTAASVAPPAAA
jgi:polar amino acid transport system substrate-binding protein